MADDLSLTERLDARQTLKLFQKAVTNGWNVPDQTVAAVHSVAARILTNSNASVRDQLRAGEVLLSIASKRADLLRESIRTELAVTAAEREIGTTAGGLDDIRRLLES